jgi:hypothetical protein
MQRMFWPRRGESSTVLDRRINCWDHVCFLAGRADGDRVPTLGFCPLPELSRDPHHHSYVLELLPVAIFDVDVNLASNVLAHMRADRRTSGCPCTRCNSMQPLVRPAGRIRRPLLGCRWTAVSVGRGGVRARLERLAGRYGGGRATPLMAEYGCPSAVPGDRDRIFRGLVRGRGGPFRRGRACE